MPPCAVAIPEPLSQPFDGGLAYKNRCARVPPRAAPPPAPCRSSPRCRCRRRLRAFSQPTPVADSCLLPAAASRRRGSRTIRVRFLQPPPLRFGTRSPSHTLIPRDAPSGGLRAQRSLAPRVYSAHRRARFLTGAGTCRPDLRLPDRDVAACYDDDHSVALESVVPAPEVGVRTTHVDMHGTSPRGSNETFSRGFSTTT